MGPEAAIPCFKGMFSVQLPGTKVIPTTQAEKNVEYKSD
jgi:hypothetical protein